MEKLNNKINNLFFIDNEISLMYTITRISEKRQKRGSITWN